MAEAGEAKKSELYTLQSMSDYAKLYDVTAIMRDLVTKGPVYKEIQTRFGNDAVRELLDPSGKVSITNMAKFINKYSKKPGCAHLFGACSKMSQSEFYRLGKYAVEIGHINDRKDLGYIPDLEDIDAEAQRFVKTQADAYKAAQEKSAKADQDVKDAVVARRKGTGKVLRNIFIGALVSAIPIAVVGALGVAVGGIVASALTSTFGIASGAGVAGIVTLGVLAPRGFSWIADTISNQFKKIKESWIERFGFEEGLGAKVRDARRNRRSIKAAERIAEKTINHTNAFIANDRYPGLGLNNIMAEALNDMGDIYFDPVSAPGSTPVSSSVSTPASASASTSAPSVTPTASASTSAPRVTPTASASTSAPRVTPTASASTSAPSVTPTASASTSAPSVTPTVSASTSAPSVTPTARASTSAPRVTPTASASTSTPSVTPIVSAESSAPRVTPTASASTSAPRVTPTASASTSAPSVTPTASASTSAPSVTPTPAPENPQVAAIRKDMEQRYNKAIANNEYFDFVEYMAETGFSRELVSEAERGLPADLIRQNARNCPLWKKYAGALSARVDIFRGSGTEIDLENYRNADGTLKDLDVEIFDILSYGLSEEDSDEYSKLIDENVYDTRRQAKFLYKANNIEFTENERGFGIPKHVVSDEEWSKIKASVRLRAKLGLINDNIKPEPEKIGGKPPIKPTEEVNLENSEEDQIVLEEGEEPSVDTFARYALLVLNDPKSHIRAVMKDKLKAKASVKDVKKAALKDIELMLINSPSKVDKKTAAEVCKKIDKEVERIVKAEAALAKQEETKLENKPEYITVFVGDGKTTKKQLRMPVELANKITAVIEKHPGDTEKIRELLNNDEIKTALVPVIKEISASDPTITTDAIIDAMAEGFEKDENTISVYFENQNQDSVEISTGTSAGEVRNEEIVSGVSDDEANKTTTGFAPVDTTSAILGTGLEVPPTFTKVTKRTETTVGDKTTVKVVTGFMNVSRVADIQKKIKAGKIQRLRPATFARVINEDGTVETKVVSIEEKKRLVAEGKAKAGPVKFKVQKVTRRAVGGVKPAENSEETVSAENNPRDEAIKILQNRIKENEDALERSRKHANAKSSKTKGNKERRLAGVINEDKKRLEALLNGNLSEEEIAKILESAKAKEVVDGNQAKVVEDKTQAKEVVNGNQAKENSIDIAHEKLLSGDVESLGEKGSEAHARFTELEQSLDNNRIKGMTNIESAEYYQDMAREADVVLGDLGAQRELWLEGQEAAIKAGHKDKIIMVKGSDLGYTTDAKIAQEYGVAFAHEITEYSRQKYQAEIDKEKGERIYKEILEAEEEQERIIKEVADMIDGANDATGSTDGEFDSEDKKVAEATKEEVSQVRDANDEAASNNREDAELDEKAKKKIADLEKKIEDKKAEKARLKEEEKKLKESEELKKLKEGEIQQIQEASKKLTEIQERMAKWEAETVRARQDGNKVKDHRAYKFGVKEVGTNNLDGYGIPIAKEINDNKTELNVVMAQLEGKEGALEVLKKLKELEASQKAVEKEIKNLQTRKNRAKKAAKTQKTTEEKKVNEDKTKAKKPKASKETDNKAKASDAKADKKPESTIEGVHMDIVREIEAGKYVDINEFMKGKLSTEEKKIVRQMLRDNGYYKKNNKLKQQETAKLVEKDETSKVESVSHEEARDQNLIDELTKDLENGEKLYVVRNGKVVALKTKTAIEKAVRNGEVVSAEEKQITIEDVEKELDESNKKEDKENITKVKDKTTGVVKEETTEVVKDKNTEAKVKSATEKAGKTTGDVKEETTEVVKDGTAETKVNASTVEVVKDGTAETKVNEDSTEVGPKQDSVASELTQAAMNAQKFVEELSGVSQEEAAERLQAEIDAGNINKYQAQLIANRLKEMNSTNDMDDDDPGME